MFRKREKESEDNNASPEDYVSGSVEGLRILTEAHTQTWGLGTANNWDADLDAGTLTFTFDDKTVEAPINVVGTYSSTEGSFMWGWDHPSVPHRLQQAAQAAKSWGEENNQAAYVEHVTSCSEDEAWQFTAVATRLTDANGAYRGVSGSTYVFMTFGQTTIRKL